MAVNLHALDDGSGIEPLWPPLARSSVWCHTEPRQCRQKVRIDNSLTIALYGREMGSPMVSMMPRTPRSVPPGGKTM